MKRPDAEKLCKTFRSKLKTEGYPINSLDEEFPVSTIFQLTKPLENQLRELEGKAWKYKIKGIKYIDLFSRT